MQHYRFYGLVGTMILHAEDVLCANDSQASVEAQARLGPSAFDAIEVWQGTRVVCRHERSTHGAALLPG
jgi:hypothetical protein